MFRFCGNPNSFILDLARLFHSVLEADAVERGLDLRAERTRLGVHAAELRRVRRVDDEEEARDDVRLVRLHPDVVRRLPQLVRYHLVDEHVARMCIIERQRCLIKKPQPS
jgi:hypothetical protein